MRNFGICRTRGARAGRLVSCYIFFFPEPFEQHILGCILH